MGKAMSNDINSTIVRALAQGHSRNDIAKMCGVSTRAVTRVSTNLKKHGMPRPPPSGVKQGRPAKMTRRQADALLAWITARNYTFYVKDLVVFLRDHYGYQGCDGTARRALLRSGFKRKEPYHKSEITVWIPPEQPPQFDVILDEDDERRVASKKRKRGDPEQQDQEPQPQPQPPNGEQQALDQNDFAPQTSNVAPDAPMASAPDDPENVLNSFSADYYQQRVAFQDQAPPPLLDPTLYHAGIEPPAVRPSSAPKTPTRASPQKKPRKPRKEDVLQNQVNTMQSELEKQNELIRQLQAQLAETQTPSQPEHVEQRPMTASGAIEEAPDHHMQHVASSQSFEEEVAV